MPNYRKRHQQNTNLNLHYDPVYKGFTVLKNHGPLISEYLAKIHQTIEIASTAYRRTFAVRVDLRFPLGMSEYDTEAISRFMASLRAQINSDVSRTNKLYRKHDTELRYVWVKEYSDSMNCHYHVLLLLNHDTYRALGDYKKWDGNLAGRIKKAWASALGLPWDETEGLVHFPERGQYRLLDNDIYNYHEVYDRLFQRVSYFAKVSTKYYGDSSNHFGCSRH